MEELRKIAEAYFEVASNEIKEEAYKFFIEMDNNGDRVVSLHEFLDFMLQERYIERRSSDLFKQLCRGNRENLEFIDVMTLYYIIRSGRPFCDGCNQFIKDIYFCCIQCFHKSERNYCLCTNCFKAKDINRGSNDHQHQFVDNFTLLELKRIDASRGTAAASNQGKHRKRKAMKKVVRKLLVGVSSSHIETPNALVPAAAAGSSTSLQLVPPEAVTEEKHRNSKAALKALERILRGGAGVAQIIGCIAM